ncbi:hypothetical protein EIP91_006740 [Steccherinum ochraceum]|uniref:Uncharacterized protein n=1 Tax=Steccherinum ochraceum TaxID=92696 RepID=A0A4R0R5G3_9APHY|nr:hypothetical protein EIP91_006740 [Steccherinum ochraceum]
MVSSYATVLTVLLSLFVPALAHWEDERPHHHVHHHHQHYHYLHPGHFHTPWRAHHHAHPLPEYHAHEPSLLEHNAPQSPLRLSTHQDVPLEARDLGSFFNDVGAKVAGLVTGKPDDASASDSGGSNLPPVPGHGVPVGAYMTRRTLGEWMKSIGAREHGELMGRSFLQTIGADLENVLTPLSKILKRK